MSTRRRSVNASRTISLRRKKKTNPPIFDRREISSRSLSVLAHRSFSIDTWYVLKNNLQLGSKRVRVCEKERTREWEELRESSRDTSNYTRECVYVCIARVRKRMRMIQTKKKKETKNSLTRNLDFCVPVRREKRGDTCIFINYYYYKGSYKKKTRRDV